MKFLIKISLLIYSFSLVYNQVIITHQNFIKLGKKFNITVILNNTDSLIFIPVKSKNLITKYQKKNDTLLITIQSFLTDSIQCIPIRLYKTTELDTILQLDTSVCMPFKSSLSLYDKEITYLKKYKELPIPETKKSTLFLYYLIIITFLGIVIVILYKPLKRKYKIYKYKKFLSQYQEKLNKLTNLENQKEFIYSINKIWKEIFSKLLGENYNAMTLKEIVKNIPPEFKDIIRLYQTEYVIFYENKKVPISELQELKKIINNIINILKQNYDKYLFRK